MTVVKECKGFVVFTSLLVKTDEATVVVCLKTKLYVFVQSLWIPSAGQMSVDVSFFKVLSGNKGRGLGSFEYGILRVYSTQLLKGMIRRVQSI